MSGLKKSKNPRVRANGAIATRAPHGIIGQACGRKIHARETVAVIFGLSTDARAAVRRESPCTLSDRRDNVMRRSPWIAINLGNERVVISLARVNRANATT